MSDQTYYNWEAGYGGMAVSDVRRLKHENRRLKQLVADLTLDNQALKGSSQKTSKAKARREAVVFMIGSFGLSLRRASGLAGLSRNTLRVV